MRVGSTLLVALALAAGAGATEPPSKVLRYAMRGAESGFDPVKVADGFSREIMVHIFEGLVTYDPLALPPKLVPLVAVDMPVPNADFTEWTVQIRPGIRFQDDPAFEGRPRELTAEDFAYSLKRFADPRLASPSWAVLESLQILGLNEAREAALKGRKAFDYDRPVAGLQVLDRYTLRYRLARPRPRFVERLADSLTFGAVAREVIEAAGERSTERPVGTGPFVLQQWRRGSLIVLERNPSYRARLYDAEPAADDIEGQALLARLKGRRLPMVDRVEVSVISEDQPRWLSFLGGEHDLLRLVPDAFAVQAAPLGQLAPYLAHRGMSLHRVMAADVFMLFFNMEDPVVGGFAPTQVALRRAVGLAMDVPKEIRLARRGQAIVAQSIYPPHTGGHDPRLKSSNGDHDPARARALLDVYGYVDRDGDGCRDRPGGGPLPLTMSTHPEAGQRTIDELFDKDMRRVGLCFNFKLAKWQEQLKTARAGKLQVWTVAYGSLLSDAHEAATRFSSRHFGTPNLARFRHAQADRLVDAISELPDGEERLDKMRQLERLALAYAPYKFKGHRYYLDISGPRVQGYRRAIFNTSFWPYVDILPGPTPP